MEPNYDNFYKEYRLISINHNRLTPEYRRDISANGGVSLVSVTLSLITTGYGEVEFGKVLDSNVHIGHEYLSLIEFGTRDIIIRQALRGHFCLAVVSFSTHHPTVTPEQL